MTSINRSNLIITYLVITNTITYIAAKSYEKALIKQKKQYKSLYDSAAYLASMIDERGISLTEFDMIVLQTITDEFKEI